MIDSVILCARTDFWEPVLYGRITCSAFLQGGGAWSCLFLICQTLLTTQRRPYPHEEWRGSGAGKVGGRRNGGRGNWGWYWD